MNVRNARRRLTTIIVLTSVAILVQGCASAPPRINPIPEALAESAEIPGVPNARNWADSVKRSKYIQAWFKASDEEIRARYSGILDREHVYLAISGGGDNGAFGAGLLTGWSKSGTRPEFTMVTGVSTGGLIAPFAFLGPAYDEKLKEMYTSYSTTDLVTKRSVTNIIRNDAFADTAPMRALIAKYMDQEMMEAIAVEHRKGRALLIGTTNIDAGRPVMWRIGPIAASGDSGSLELIRNIMLASASIPGAFPPVSIEVEADGERYEELHVDGGVTSQVFLYPIGIDWRKVQRRLNVQGRPKLYVIRNAFLDPQFKTVKRKIVPIVGRTVSTLIRTQGIGDIFRLYLGSVRDGIEFHLASIPADVEYTAKEAFDREYMNTLFDRGYTMAVEGFPWVKDPLGLDEAAVKWFEK